MALDFGSGAKPLWSQLADELRGKIENGEYTVGTILPPEIQIGESYNVSRITVRQALERLMTEGYITRQRGKGTIVQRTSNTLSTRIQSSFKQLEEKSIFNSKKLVAVELLQAPEEVVEFFDINENTNVIRMKRNTEVDDNLVGIFHNYINPKVPITLQDNFRGSFYKLLESKGYVITSVKEIISAKISDEQDMKDFGLSEVKALITRKKYGYSSGICVEATYCRYIADDYNIMMELI